MISRPLAAACVLFAASSWGADQSPPPAGAPSTTASPNGAAAPASPATAPAPPAPLTAEEASYLIGVSQGESLHRMGIAGSLSTEALARGSKDGLAGKKTSPQDGQRLQAYVRGVMEAATAKN
jgi:hypothetical protein